MEAFQEFYDHVKDPETAKVSIFDEPMNLPALLHIEPKPQK